MAKHRTLDDMAKDINHASGGAIARSDARLYDAVNNELSQKVHRITRNYIEATIHDIINISVESRCGDVTYIELFDALEAYHA